MEDILLELVIQCQTVLGVVQPKHEQQSQMIIRFTLDLSLQTAQIKPTGMLPSHAPTVQV